MFKNAIIAGKFYPFHYGHHHLIETALKQSEHVYVLVVFKSTEKPDYNQRCDAIINAFAVDMDAKKLTIVPTIDIVTNDADPSSSVTWANYTRDLLGEGVVIDAVFSSEDYGVNWAKCLNAEHVVVDGQRTLHAISGTEIRNDPLKHFLHIHPEMRYFYNLKVLLIGAESTGKTTLAKFLANHYDTVHVPEYGRWYVEKYGENTDQRLIFPMIVREQPNLEYELSKRSNRLLICDTDLYTTSLWYEVWQPTCKGDALHQTILDTAALLDYDIVLLSNHEGTQWVDDGYRDQEHTREWFTTRLSTIYNEHPNYYILKGTWEERQREAIQRINELVATYKTEWTPPLYKG